MLYPSGVGVYGLNWQQAKQHKWHTQNSNDKVLLAAQSVSCGDSNNFVLFGENFKLNFSLIMETWVECNLSIYMSICCMCVCLRLDVPNGYN